MKIFVTALAFASFAFPAGDPEGFQMWTSAGLKAYSKSLAPKIDAKKVASQPLFSQGNYAFQIAHREGNGEAEWHEKHADIFVVQTGAATLVYGGKVVDGKTTAPNEIRGPSISGGLEKKLSPGDVVTIPAKTPHQLKVDKEFTYFVVKVAQ